MSSSCITSADNVAESAAESLHRPLYYISGAELGMLHDIHAGSMEDKLELIFKRIARWEAILLFDEAESFVASRQSESHNAQKIVSPTLTRRSSRVSISHSHSKHSPLHIAASSGRNWLRKRTTISPKMTSID
jgi:hypothetical protein